MIQCRLFFSISVKQNRLELTEQRSTELSKVFFLFFWGQRVQASSLPICDDESLRLEELEVIALWPAVSHWETSQHSERHLIWSVNKSDRMCCDMCWWTEQCCQRLSSHSDTDLTRQTLFTPHLAIISAHRVYILLLHATVKHTVFQLCKYFSPKGGAFISLANIAVLDLSRIKCSSWIMVHRDIYIFIYYYWNLHQNCRACLSEVFKCWCSADVLFIFYIGQMINLESHTVCKDNKYHFDAFIKNQD